jgi:hypothetical protein
VVYNHNVIRFVSFKQNVLDMFWVGFTPNVNFSDLSNCWI